VFTTHAPRGNRHKPGFDSLLEESAASRSCRDDDPARLYGVETKALDRAVKGDRSRFLQDFVFQLTDE
jgi:hypothetical protein